MLAPQSGQTRLRIAEIKLILRFLTTANKAIMPLPALVAPHHRMHRTLSAGPQTRFGQGARWIGLRPLASDSNMGATVSPNALLGRNARSSLEIFSRRVIIQGIRLDLPCCTSSNGNSSAMETSVDAVTPVEGRLVNDLSGGRAIKITTVVVAHALRRDQ